MSEKLPQSGVMDKDALFHHVNLRLEKPVQSIQELDLILKRLNLSDRAQFGSKDVEIVTSSCNAAYEKKAFEKNIFSVVNETSKNIAVQIGRALGHTQVLLEIAIRETLTREISWLGNKENRPTIRKSLSVCRNILLESPNTDEARTQWLKYLQTHPITSVPPQKIRLTRSLRSPST
jgi:hypothetical protein